MKIGFILAFALVSLSSVACAVSPDDTAQDEKVEQSEEQLAIGAGGTTTSLLTCHRFPTDSCVTVGAYCERHGGKLWCDLYGNCTCKYDAFQYAR